MQKIGQYHGQPVSLVLLEEKMAADMGLQLFNCTCGMRFVTLFYSSFHVEKSHPGDDIKDRISIRMDFATDKNLWQDYYSSVTDNICKSLGLGKLPSNELSQLSPISPVTTIIDEPTPVSNDCPPKLSNLWIQVRGTPEPQSDAFDDKEDPNENPDESQSIQGNVKEMQLQKVPSPHKTVRVTRSRKRTRADASILDAYDETALRKPRRVKRIHNYKDLSDSEVSTAPVAVFLKLPEHCPGRQFLPGRLFGILETTRAKISCPGSLPGQANSTRAKCSGKRLPEDHFH